MDTISCNLTPGIGHHVNYMAKKVSYILLDIFVFFFQIYNAKWLVFRKNLIIITLPLIGIVSLSNYLRINRMRDPEIGDFLQPIQNEATA